MNERELRKKMSNKIMEIQLLPNITEVSLKEVEYIKYPIENLSALGVATQPIVSIMQSLGKKSGNSGIYRLNTKGLEMFESQGGYIGSLKTTEGAVGGGQAVMTPLEFNPSIIFMSMTLMTIENKLNDVQNLQKEMINFVKTKEKSNLRGNMNILIDILNNYKFNCNNEKYKTNKHILVQDIRRSSEQSILLYRDLIQAMLAKKELIHNKQEINSKINKASENLKEYQIAIYLFSFSSFLEVMLLENFNKDYLESVKNKIDEYVLRYKELYTECYNEIESYTNKSIQSIFNKSISRLSKGTGKVVSKIPLVNKGYIDEFLIEKSEKIDKFNDKENQKLIQELITNSMKGPNPFIEFINQINKIYNEPIEVLIDNKNLYLIEGEL